MTKLPAYLVNQIASQLNISPVISNISSRIYGNYISLIRQYFKTSFSKKAHYKELEVWIKDVLLPTPHLTDEDKRALMPLIYEHINPYALFPLDLSTRLPHLHYKVAA